jgi:hypothetical protein
MNTFLKIIYAQFYSWGCRWNFANSPHLSAMYLLSLLLTLNVGTFTMMLLWFLGFRNFGLFFQPNFIILIVLAIVTFLIYMLYTRNKKYLIISQAFNSKPPSVKRKYTLITVLYIVITLLLLYGVAVILGMLERGEL